MNSLSGKSKDEYKLVRPAVPNSEVVVSETEKSLSEPPNADSPECLTDVSPVITDKKIKQRHRIYSEDDIAFILDESNSPQDIVDMFGLQSKVAAYSLRNYHRRKSARK